MKRLQKEIRDSLESAAATLLQSDKEHNPTQDAWLNKIHHWLSAPDPSTNYQKALKQRQHNTGLWFLEGERYARWKTDTASSLWLYGIPGCGKTILSSTILQDLLQHRDSNPRHAVAYFYFDFNDVQKQDAEPMLRSLICQLSRQAIDVPASLDALFSSCEDGKRQPSLDALLQVACRTMQQLPQVYVMLDALDECAQRTELMEMLETITGWQFRNMHLIVTSRQERDIESSLEGFVDVRNSICLQSDIVDKDIQQYVRQRLSDDKGLSKWGKDVFLRQEIETALMEGSKGMFRWAVCQLDTLGKCRNRADLRKALATLPPTLDKTYDRILCAIAAEDAVYAVRVLLWLAFSERPLTVDEVAEVVAIDVARDPAFNRDEVLEDPLEALDICSSLVTIATDNGNGRLQSTMQVVVLAHYSVKEYLVSDRIQRGQAARYSMQPAACHSTIARACLGYLGQFQKSEPMMEDTLGECKLARYSAEFWLSHAQKAGDRAAETSQAALHLLSRDNAAYLNWIRIHDPERPWSEPDLGRRLEETPAPLYYAALFGLQEVVSLLIDESADVDVQGGHYGNALQAASWEGHEAVVRLLLDKDADANAQGGVYGNALQAASAKGHEQIAKLLLGAHAAVNAQGGHYSNALHAALVGTHETTVRMLLERGANVGLDLRLKGAMHHALNNGSCMPSLVRVLQQYGAPLDTIDVDNMTPLHYCVKFGYKTMARQLIDAGVPIDSRVHRQAWPSEVSKSISGKEESMLPASGSVANGLTPLHFAALTGNLTMTKFLLEHGADPNALSDYGETPLHLTLRTTLFGTRYQDDWTDSYLRAESLQDFLDFEEDDVDAVLAEISLKREGVLDALLSDPRISLTVTDCKGESPLHCIQYGKPETATLVQNLVLRGADPFNRNLSQQSPLHFASKAGDHVSVRTLLLLGAKVALTDEHGLNALHYAAQSGNHETIIAILETEEAREVNLVALKDKCGQNVLHHMLSTDSIKYVETVRSLLDQGADGSELDNSGISPLARFIKSSMLRIDFEICRSLLEIKGNVSFVDCDGQTLGHLCARTFDFGVHILKLLVEHGIDLVKRDYDGRTVLHRAAICGSLTEQSLQFLVNVIGIQADEEDTFGRTALQYVTELAAEDRSLNTWDSKR
ncbi:uncharacterized protein ALTATR162_LOCUS5073 [Alternaria atra]|uniref:NACHT domain-containing protein n=1 Tax=Alternaria atra TaxID=119953 RepID=A0A8J2MZM6_9PLEO|nr:uncharacterized protein ALTATR162_LOCUS5073 [Alternaria atra]CAG5158427.1 unnamed protein product [Alternaria atra]